MSGDAAVLTMSIVIFVVMLLADWEGWDVSPGPAPWEPDEDPDGEIPPG